MIKAMDEMSRKLVRLSEIEGIAREGRRKQELSQYFRDLKSWIGVSPSRLVAVCFFVYALLKKETQDTLSRASESADISISFKDTPIKIGKRNQVPSEDLIKALEIKIAHYIAESLLQDSFLKKMFKYLATNFSLYNGILDMFFKVDLLPVRSRLSWYEKLLRLYCENLTNEEAEGSIVTAIILSLTTDDERSYRNREEWMNQMVSRCISSKKDADVLYELFFTVNHDYKIVPIKRSDFLNKHLAENHASLSRESSEEDTASPLYWDIPDNIFDEAVEITVKRFDECAERAAKTIGFLKEHNDQMRDAVGALWEEIEQRFNRALRSGGRDSIFIDCPIFNEGAKIYRVAFITEGYCSPEVGLRLYFKRGPIEYEYDGGLVMKVVDEKEVICLVAPTIMKNWFSNLLLTIIIDAYHSIVVKNRSELRGNSGGKIASAGKGSRDHYVASPEDDVIRAQVRRLPIGHKPRWEEDDLRREKCLEHYGGNIPEGFTFVKEYPKPQQNKEAMGITKKDLYTYREEDIYSLAR